MGCNQHHPVAGIGAANIPGGVKANVASEIESAYRRTFLACIFHQSGKSMAPLRRCHAFQPIALHIPAAAIILCLHGVEIQAHEGKRNNHEHANDTPGRQAAISHVSAQATYPRSEEHTSELQSLMRISYAVFC